MQVRTGYERWPPDALEVIRLILRLTSFKANLHISSPDCRIPAENELLPEICRRQPDSECNRGGYFESKTVKILESLKQKTMI